MKKPATHSRLASAQQGYSVIELMVASVIGLFVLSAAVTVFTGNKSSQELSTGMARLQESGRVALDILSNDLRLTGYQGCTNGTKIPDVIATVAPRINMPVEALWGGEYNGGWSPTIHPDLTDISTRPKAGTDVIYVQHGSGRNTMLTISMVSANGPITLLNNPDQLVAGDLVMISNCSNSDIFRTTSVSSPTSAGNVTVGFAAGTSNSRSTLNHAYTVDNTNPIADPMRVMRFESHAYFVGDTGRNDSNGDDIFSLYILDTSAATTPYVPIELVEGVENMQIMYGERLASNQIRYLPAGTPGLDIDNVVSIQIGLLMTSIDEVTSDNDNRTYLLANVQVGPPSGSNTIKHSGGKRMRAAFNTTIQLRNRRL
ncbi:MAG: PilW family protein [Pseudomonadota bacterium]